MRPHFAHVNSNWQRQRLMFVLSIGCLTAIFVSLSLLLISQDNPSKDVSPVIIQTQAKLETVPALIPIQSIAAGDMLEASMFRVESRPKSGLLPQTLASYEQIRNTYAKTLIIPNQPLHADYITRDRPTNAVTSAIPDGYRAVTIHVDERTSIEGWARAGAMVDVSWSTTMRGKPAVSLIVQNAKVISAARKVEGESKQQIDGDFPTELTLLVTIEDAKKILLAQLSGTLSLALRGDKESNRNVSKSTITTDDLISGGNGDIQKQKENIVKIRGKNGEYEEFVLRDGRLLPVFQALTTGANSLSSFTG